MKRWVILMTSSEKAITDEIRRHPYYSVRLRPAGLAGKLALSDAKTLAMKNAVQLRGWDFPHFDANTVASTPEYVFNTVSWGNHLELWRLYRSGQFVYLGNVWDVFEDIQKRLRAEFDRDVIANESQKASVTGCLSFIGMIYSVTEFCLFCARLAKAIEARSIDLDISLHGVGGWALVTGDPAVPWHQFYQSQSDEIQVLAPGADVMADPVAASATALETIFQCFNWDNPAPAIASWQQRFMSGRYAF